MADTRKIKGVVVSFRTRRGVLVYRLTKKLPGGSLHIAGRFTMRVVRNGAATYFPLPSKQRDAENEANKIDAFLDVRSNTVEAAVRLFNPDGWAKRNPTAKLATVGDVLKAHEEAEKALGIDGFSTGPSYRQALIVVFRYGLAFRKRGKEPGDDDIKGMSLSELTSRLFADFKVHRLAQAGEDKTEQERKKRSANQVIRSVAALFSEAAREHYTHLSLPADIESVLKKAPFKKVSKIKKRLPSAGVLRNLFEAARELRENDKNAYLAFLLAGHAGFRKAEASASVREWIERGEKPRLWVRNTAEFKIKDRDERVIDVQSWVIDEIDALCDSPSFILSGVKSERERLTFDRLNAWVKNHGVADERKNDKGVHALRFLFGSYRANRFGMYDAQRMLGHESPETTSDHYADIILDRTLFDLWEKRPEWAVKPKPVGAKAVNS